MRNISSDNLCNWEKCNRRLSIHEIDITDVSFIWLSVIYLIKKSQYILHNFTDKARGLKHWIWSRFCAKWSNSWTHCLIFFIFFSKHTTKEQQNWDASVIYCYILTNYSPGVVNLFVKPCFSRIQSDLSLLGSGYKMLKWD